MPVEPNVGTVAAGPAAPTEAQPFAFQSMSYPADLGNGRYPHVFQININIQGKSRFTSGAGTAYTGGGGVTAQNQKADTAAGRNVTGVIQVGGGGGEAGAKPVNNGGDGQKVEGSAASLSLGQKTNRIAQTIRLYMPDTMTWDFSQEYSEKNLTDELGVALQAAQGITGAFSKVDNTQNGQKGGTLSSLAPAAAEAAGTAMGGGAKTQIAMGITGYAVNPQIEVLYTSPKLRAFQFDFTFAPKSSAEAKNVIDIIGALKFHSAPEILGGFSGRYFVPPATFDISFLFGGGRNDKLGRIASCVLDRLNVDYAPNGYTTFKDGMPTYIRIQLSFKELEFITKERVKEGF
jgi:hypothetical protein